MAFENLDLTTTGGLAAGGGVVLATLYTALRKIKGDVRIDKVDDATQKLINSLMDQHEKDTAAIERLATERNGAVERVGSLETTVKYQTVELERMSAEVCKLEDEVRVLFSQNHHYTAEVDALRAENATLQKQSNELLSQSLAMGTQMAAMQETLEKLTAAVGTKPPQPSNQ